jgi:glycerophosphoryl diester phosphodiesterase
MKLGRRTRLGLFGAAVLVIVAALYIVNASWLAPDPSGQLTLLAHRGVHQTFSEAGVTDSTCTATRIDPPTHAFIENTIPSMRRAFEFGADIVELDIHPTTDGDFVVFHDWTLECRTNGRGVTREHTLAELKQLDVGYGYTADGGRTYPLRGTGVGMMPSLAETLAAFPGRRFLINIKSNDPGEAERLAAYLTARAPEAARRITVYGGERPIERLRELRPDITVWTPGQARTCLVVYELVGWSGYVPAKCRRAMVFVPEDYAWLVWGWPNRFLARMQSVGSEVFVAGAPTERMGLGAIDDTAQVARLPTGWRGGVSTERIDTVGPLLRPAPPK